MVNIQLTSRAKLTNQHTKATCEANLQLFSHLLLEIYQGHFYRRGGIKETSPYHDPNYFIRIERLFKKIIRCIYARYADNLITRRGLEKIKTKKELLDNIYNIFEYYDNKIENFRGSGRLCTPEIQQAIFNALDHFSVINALKKLYILLDFIITVIQPRNILNITYYANSDFNHRSANIKIFKNHHMELDFNSVATDINCITLNPTEKYELQYVRFFSSIMRIYHSHNFKITIQKGQNRFTYDTNNDLFTRYNAGTDTYNINSFKLNKLKMNKVNAKNLIKFINNANQLELNKQYKQNSPLLENFNINNVYLNSAKNLTKDDTISLYLDLFKPKDEFHYKYRNKIIDLLRKYSTTYKGISSENLLNIENTIYSRLLNLGLRDIPLENIPAGLEDPICYKSSIPPNMYIQYTEGFFPPNERGVARAAPSSNSSSNSSSSSSSNSSSNSSSSSGSSNSRFSENAPKVTLEVASGVSESKPVSTVKAKKPKKSKKKGKKGKKSKKIKRINVNNIFL